MPNNHLHSIIHRRDHNEKRLLDQEENFGDDPGCNFCGGCLLADGCNGNRSNGKVVRGR
jgi:hypothetical protein